MSSAKFVATKLEVFNRGVAPDSFLEELVAWARLAPEAIFAQNESKTDIYGKVKAELGPWELDNRAIAAMASIPEEKVLPWHHRRAVMLEVMRVLAGFESSFDWAEGVDTSRLGDDTPSNSEAGAWQVSFDARAIHPSLAAMLNAKGITNGIMFQRAMKFDHPLAMDFVSSLMRWTTHHNGPLYKGSERDAIRRSLREAKHSIYPWLSRDSVAEFMRLLS